MATPLDALRTHSYTPEARATVAGVLGSHASFGNIGGKGWEWIAAGLPRSAASGCCSSASSPGTCRSPSSARWR